MKTRDYNNDYHIKKNDEIVDRYVHELMKISSGIVIKQQVLANKYETPATNNAYGEYYLAYNQLDTIDNHEFTNRELEDVGMTPDEINDFRINKHNISPAQEELLMNNTRHKIINEYEEKNIRLVWTTFDGAYSCCWRQNQGGVCGKQCDMGHDNY